MNQKQCKDYMASYLLRQGVNKQSIIAICNNVMGESAFITDRLEPMEPSGAQGVGLFQYSWPPTNRNIQRYCRTHHSDADRIRYQCNIMLRNNPAQWIGGPSFNAFLHNTGGWGWRTLTTMWCRYWERPYSWAIEGPKRQGNYDWVMPINWDAYDGKGGGSKHDGNGNKTPNHNKPKHKKKKTGNGDDCLNAPAKGKHAGGSKHNKTPDDTGSHKDIKTKLDMDEINKLIKRLQANHLMYSMGLRSAILTSGKYSDCSAFVSYAVELGLHSKDRTLCNTETLHGWLERKGFRLIQSGADKLTPKNLRAGDVFILGRKGTSIGAGGHTAIMLSSNTIAECSTGWPGGYPGGSDIYTHAFSTWWNVDKNAFPNNWYYYIYRKA